MPRVGAPEGQTRGAARPPALLRATPPAMDLPHHFAALVFDCVTEANWLLRLRPRTRPGSGISELRSFDPPAGACAACLDTLRSADDYWRGTGYCRLHCRLRRCPSRLSRVLPLS